MQYANAGTGTEKVFFTRTACDMVNGQVMGCLPQAGGELKDHWAHFQSIFLRRLCLSQIVQVPINANRTNEVIVRYRSRIDVCKVAYGLGVLALAC